MQSPPPALKKALIAEGFEIYRTGPNLIFLADRVRDNLLMDSGVSVVHAESLGVRLVLRAQALDFPGEDANSLFDRARSLASAFDGRGYAEIAASAVPIRDPSDKARTLDTWYEVSYERLVRDETELYSELRFVLALVKVVTRT
jgi:hypothetical protein